MKNFISFFHFENIFKNNSEQIFKLFNHKLLDEMNKNFHEKMIINDLLIHSTWCDDNKNRHIILKGNVSFGPENSTVLGEIVWLAKLKTFRGYLKDFFVDTSSAYCLNQARTAFRNGEYNKCIEYLSLVSEDDKLKKFVVKLEQLSNKYINFKIE